MTAQEDPRVEKIRKLLAMAEDPGCTVEARLTYSSKASELMLKWGIDQLAVTPQESSQIRQVRVNCSAPKTYSTEYAHLGVVAAEQFNCRGLLFTVADGSTGAVLVGFPEDTQLASQLFRSLEIQCTAALEQYVRSSWGWRGFPASEKVRLKRAFVRGFAIGAARVLDETRKDVMHSVSEETAVALYDRKKLVNEYIEERMSTKRTKSRNYETSAMNSGYHAGTRADIGTKRLSHAS